MQKMIEIKKASQPEINSLQLQLNKDADQRIGQVVSDSLGIGEECYSILVNGDVAGFCTFRRGSSELFTLLVFSDFRGQGVGAAAVKELLKLLRAQGVSEILLMVVNDAGPFWEKVFTGYAVTPIHENKYSVAITLPRPALLP